MKRFRALLIMMMCVMCLTGCVRFNTTVNVRRNGRMDVSILMAMVSVSDYGLGGDFISDADKQDYIDKGWTVEDYDQDGFEGILISREDISAEELKESMEDSDSEISEGMGDISFTRDGFKYTLDWTVFGSDYASEISSYKSYFNMSGGYMTFVVKLPVKATDSNATRVSDDGRTLEWDLLELGPDNRIHVEFSLFDFKFLLIIWTVAFFVILAIVLIVIAVSNRKKKRLQRLQVPDGGHYGQPPQ